MKWPLVSRHAHDQIVDLLSNTLAIEQRRADALTNVVIAMKVAGGAVPSRPGAAAAPRAVDKCVQAIDNNKYSARPQMRAVLMNFLERERQKGTAEEVIEQRLTQWSNVPNASAAMDADDDDDDTITITTR